MANLDAQHTRPAIKERLTVSRKHNYLGDSILGAIDGTVTTFAIISGIAGAGLRCEIAIVLGLANLFGDGFSMAVSNFLRVRSEKEIIEQARRTEEQHIEYVPEGEREEIRQIFAQKGFNGDVLEKIVDTITQSHQKWVDTMLVEELGLSLDIPEPYKAALYTFFSFCLAGTVPVIPFVLMLYSNNFNVFLVSTVLTVLVFFFIGMIKGIILHQNKLRSALETLFLGSGAAAIAYVIGILTRGLLE